MHATCFRNNGVGGNRIEWDSFFSVFVHGGRRPGVVTGEWVRGGMFFSVEFVFGPCRVRIWRRSGTYLAVAGSVFGPCRKGRGAALRRKQLGTGRE